VASSACATRLSAAEQRFSQVVVAPRLSILSTTKRKFADLKQRISHAVKRPRKERGQRSHSLAPSRQYFLAAIISDDDGVDDTVLAPASPPPPLFCSCPVLRVRHFESTELPRSDSLVPTESAASTIRELVPPPRSRSRSLSTSDVPTPGCAAAMPGFDPIAKQRRAQRNSTSELGGSSDRWDAVRCSISASHQRPLPYTVGKLSDRKQLKRKMQYMRDKYIHGGRRRTDKPKTHYQEPWWRNWLRSTINWMCPFVIVSKQGDVYCVSSL